MDVRGENDRGEFQIDRRPRARDATNTIDPDTAANPAAEERRAAEAEDARRRAVADSWRALAQPHISRDDRDRGVKPGYQTMDLSRYSEEATGGLLSPPMMPDERARQASYDRQRYAQDAAAAEDERRHRAHLARIGGAANSQDRARSSASRSARI